MPHTTFNRCFNACAWLAFLVCNLITVNSAYAEATLTLNEALTRTLAHNPHLYQYRFTQEALNAQRQTHALRPTMNLELEVENLAGSGSNEVFDSVETTLALSSVIELGGKRQARVSYADAQINRAQWEQQAATLDILGELTVIYIQSLATQANVWLGKESLELSRSLLKTVKTRSMQGATPEAEVMRARAAVARAEIGLAVLLEKFERQKIQLSRFWGETSPPFSQLEGSLFELKANQEFEQLYTRVKASPAIQMFASEARIRDAQVTLAQASGRSDLTWRAGIKRFEETSDLAFTAGLSIPLLANQRSSGAVKVALANRNAVDYARKDLLLRLHAQLFEAYSLRKQNITAANKIKNVVIPALEKALTLTREAYENGRNRYLDLIAAQEELLAAKQARIDTASTALISQALIEKLSGETLNQ